VSRRLADRTHGVSRKGVSPTSSSAKGGGGPTHRRRGEVGGHRPLDLREGLKPKPSRCCPRPVFQHKKRSRRRKCRSKGSISRPGIHPQDPKIATPTRAVKRRRARRPQTEKGTREDFGWKDCRRLVAEENTMKYHGRGGGQGKTG